MTVLFTPKLSSYWLVITNVPLLVLWLTFTSPPVLGKERIINGSEVNPPHKYPFMISIWFDGCFVENDTVECDGAGGHKCGASVLNKHWVVTAAHCVFALYTDPKPSPERFHVLTGLHDREKLEPWSQNLSIAEIVVHHGYDGGTTNDIALIRVNGTILFGDKVTPLNLPSCDFQVKKDGEIVGTAMGWGQFNQSRNVTERFPRELQELEVPLVTVETCQRALGVFENQYCASCPRINETTVVTDSIICAGGLDGAGLCQFDSGSPLVVLDQGTQTYIQVGVASFGQGGLCGRPGLYNGFTSIGKYLSWINSHIQRCSPNRDGARKPF